MVKMVQSYDPMNSTADEQAALYGTLVTRKDVTMSNWNFISSLVSWILSTVGNLVLTTKALVEKKKLIKDKVMPDIKEGETVEEIKRKQELARNLVAFSGVEAAYYTARGLMIAVYFSLLMHYAYKFVALTKPKSKESEGK